MRKFIFIVSLLLITAGCSDFQPSTGKKIPPIQAKTTAISNYFKSM